MAGPNPWIPTMTAASALTTDPRACRLCGSATGRPALTLGTTRRLWACGGCALVRLDPMPTAQELRQVYEGGDYYTTQPPTPRRGLAGRLQDGVLQAFWGYPGARSGLQKALLRLLLWPLRTRFMPLPFPGAGPVLDIGCGNGQRLLELQQYGVTALYGVEPTVAAAEQARLHTRADIRACLLEDAGLPREHFRLVILNQVLEHVPSPPQTLRQIHDLLVPGGWFYLTVPNFGSWEAALAGAHWDGLQVPAHLHHFTREPLLRALREAGFEIERVCTDSVADVTRNTWKALRRDRVGGAAGWLARWPLRAVQALTLLADRCGRGQMLRVVARRPEPHAHPA